MSTSRKTLVLLIALLIVTFCVNAVGVGSVLTTRVFAAEPEEAAYLEHDLIFSEHTRRYGIDVSEWQSGEDWGDIGWAQVKASGVEFAFIRVGGRYGRQSGELYEDDNAIVNIKEALNAGLKIGVYFFSQAINVEEAIEEADFTLEVLDKADVGPESVLLPVMMDVEFISSSSVLNYGRLYNAYQNDEIDTEKRTEITLAYLDRIKSAGYDAGLYASEWVLSGWHDVSQIENDYKVWIAAYMNECHYEGKYDFWQYSASGSVPGIRGNVDMDVWYEPPVIYSESEGSWRKEDGKWYFYTPDEELKRGWLLIGDKRYYMGEDGAMRRGWQKISDRWYYFGTPDNPDSGAMQKGWIKLDDRWYYMGNNGVMKHGRYEVDGRTYYFGWESDLNSGAMRRGWVKEGEDWFYYGSENDLDSGAMQIAWIYDGSNWYYLYDSGEMASYEYINGWWLNESGSWTYPHKGTWRYSSDRWWFGDDSGWYASDATYRINGVDYSFDAEGWME